MMVPARSGLNTRDLFEILAREQAGMLSVYLRAALHDAAREDDLFQEAMLTAWRTLDRFDRSRPFGPWLRGIAARLLLAERRQGSRRPLPCDAAVLEQLEANCLALSSQAGDTLDQKLEGLRDCLDQLPEPYREAIHLRYTEELTGPRLAERLQLTSEALKKRLQRARARLLECLERKLALGEARP